MDTVDTPSPTWSTRTLREPAKWETRDARAHAVQPARPVFRRGSSTPPRRVSAPIPKARDSSCCSSSRVRDASGHRPTIRADLVDHAAAAQRRRAAPRPRIAWKRLTLEMRRTSRRERLVHSVEQTRSTIRSAPVQPAPQVIVLAIGAAEERAEIVELDPAQCRARSPSRMLRASSGEMRSILTGSNSVRPSFRSRGRVATS